MEVKKGPFIYEYGDHGSIIVLAELNKGTRSIHFSWNEGMTWSDIEISDKEVEVNNIVIEPRSIS
jgi:hypothetical protein